MLIKGYFIYRLPSNIHYLFQVWWTYKSWIFHTMWYLILTMKLLNIYTICKSLFCGRTDWQYSVTGQPLFSILESWIFPRIWWSSCQKQSCSTILRISTFIQTQLWDQNIIKDKGHSGTKTIPFLINTFAILILYPDQYWLFILPG